MNKSQIAFESIPGHSWVEGEEVESDPWKRWRWRFASPAVNGCESDPLESRSFRNVCAFGLQWYWTFRSLLQICTNRRRWVGGSLRIDSFNYRALSFARTRPEIGQLKLAKWVFKVSYRKDASPDMLSINYQSSHVCVVNYGNSIIYPLLLLQMINVFARNWKLAESRTFGWCSRFIGGGGGGE